MLQITVPGAQYFNEKTSEFFDVPPKVLQLEHSLVSISKWESKWKKPFLDDNNKTKEELRDYIRCMTLTQNVDSEVYYRLSKKNYDDISEYINDKMTATWFSDEEENKKRRGRKSQTITSELIYYWMVALQIPFECQKWHINRLLTLIRICNIKNQPEKKMSKHETMSRNKAINEMRKAKYGTTG